jgi:hypothetical protein
MTQILDLTALAMGCSTSLHCNIAPGCWLINAKKMNARQFLMKNNRSICARPVKLKHVLCKVYADPDDFFHGCSPIE